MSFDSAIIHWPTVASFVEYLTSVPRPSWCTSICNHNTYRPNEYQWRGIASMRSMQATYVAKGWTSGPHLFLAAQAPNPATQGIWQMTPITHPGTHAGPCNAHYLGIESVGDYEARPPTELQYHLMLAINRAILKHWNIPYTSVVVHNECMEGRICPGQYLTGDQIRADLAPPTWAARVAGLPVYERADRTGALWGHLDPGQHVVIDDLSNGHIAQVDGVPAAIGFVDIKGLESV